MADKRISQLVDRGTVENNDVVPIVVSGASTTNKSTISSIQTFMQGNLDLGVTSVGITLGSAGTDVSVSGSPVTSSGNITINLPTASAANRGLLNGADWNTFNSKLDSVGLIMPSAFTVTNSPLTSNGSISVAGAGTVGQYIRGDGSLADFPESGGGGSSVSYYLNGSVSQGTIGGIAYKEMNKVPVIGAGTDITIAADGYIASFITDAGDPALLEIPAGNWNFETYFSASSAGGSPTFYIELYKVNSGGTATLIASNSATPELIAFGTTINPYFSPLAVPTTVLTLTDRLAVRYYVAHSGRTITLHTEDNHLCQIITTFTTGLTALNGLTAQVQNFATSTSGTDFAISSASATHTFNLPTASATNRGALSSADWTTFNGKESALTFSSPLVRTTNTISIPVATTSVNGYLSSTDWTTFNNKQNALTNPVTGTGATGQVAYWNGTNSQTGSNNLFWDNAAVKLGIGTNTPEGTGLTVAGGGVLISLDSGAARKVLELYASSTGAKVSSTYVGASSYGSLELLTSGLARLTIADTGGVTLTGALNGTSATFSGNIESTSLSASIVAGRTTGTGYFGNLTGGAYSVVYGDSHATKPNRIEISGAGGVYVLNAATFSSSVGATQGNFTSAPSLGGHQVQALSNSGTSTSYGGVLVQSVNGKAGYLTCGDNSATTWYGGQASFVTLGATSGAGIKLRVDADDTKGITIPTSGNVGIGTASVTTGKLVVKSGESNSTGIVLERGDSTDKLVNIFSTTADGKISIASGANTKIFLDSVGASYFTGGNVGIGNTGNSSYRLFVSGSDTTGSNYSIVVNNSTTTMFFVANDGLFYTGTSANSPYNNSQTGRSPILGAGGVLGYLVSTKESKANIESIKNVDFIKKLNPVQFNYRKKDNQTNTFTDELHDNITYGFIADEVEEVNKELVFYNEDGTLAGVEYNSMIAILTKAIQEQQIQINQLKNQMK